MRSNVLETKQFVNFWLKNCHKLGGSQFMELITTEKALTYEGFKTNFHNIFPSRKAFPWDNVKS